MKKNIYIKSAHRSNDESAISIERAPHRLTQPPPTTPSPALLEPLNSTRSDWRSSNIKRPVQPLINVHMPNREQQQHGRRIPSKWRRRSTQRREHGGDERSPLRLPDVAIEARDVRDVLQELRELHRRRHHTKGAA